MHTIYYSTPQEAHEGGGHWTSRSQEGFNLKPGREGRG